MYFSSLFDPQIMSNGKRNHRQMRLDGKPLSGPFWLACGTIQSLRAFRRPMHAWMLWIVVGTGRMKDAPWKKVKQGIVSCAYKYFFLLLAAYFMSGSCRL